MPKRNDISPDHFEWLVEGRSRNQKVTSYLYKIINDNEKKLTRYVNLQFAAQELTGVAFSLWRAVFLSDTTGEYADQLADVKTFLISLISDNAVLYITDKNARNWSFRYYLDDARLRLSRLSENEPGLVREDELSAPADSMKGEWLSTQMTLEAALIRFEQAASATPVPSG